MSFDACQPSLRLPFCPVATHLVPSCPRVLFVFVPSPFPTFPFSNHDPFPSFLSMVPSPPVPVYCFVINPLTLPSPLFTTPSPLLPYCQCRLLRLNTLTPPSPPFTPPRLHSLPSLTSSLLSLSPNHLTSLTSPLPSPVHYLFPFSLVASCPLFVFTFPVLPYSFSNFISLLVHFSVSSAAILPL